MFSRRAGRWVFVAFFLFRSRRAAHGVRGGTWPNLLPTTTLTADPPGRAAIKIRLRCWFVLDLSMPPVSDSSAYADWGEGREHMPSAVFVDQVWRTEVLRSF